MSLRGTICIEREVDVDFSKQDQVQLLRVQVYREA